MATPGTPAAVLGGEVAELAELATLLAPATTIAAGRPSPQVTHHAQALAFNAHRVSPEVGG